ncbi:MAG TPA: UDP-3-O-acyl-N-acetylglucosamine deacetylase [Abditibacteriaceae bacterium]|jgi:UDP-3-O-[3-hydroxymyristoyl] N-acetylglucosamine deacetylase
MHFQTFAQCAEISGVGLHSGKNVRLRLAPSERCGLRFVRTDLAHAPEISVSLKNVLTTKHATTLEHEGAVVSTTEHLLAALWCAGITHAQIELDGPEVPILDGSAAPWCELLRRAGSRHLSEQRPVFGLRTPVWIEEGNASVLALPHPSLRISVAVEYDREWVGKQSFDSEISAGTFARDIAPARTFTLQEWIEPLRVAGLIQGGSTENAVVLFEEEFSSPLRFNDEISRHKALDVLGDIALLFGENGGELRAHFIATRAGHGPHRAWMDAVLQQNALIRLR